MTHLNHNYETEVEIDIHRNYEIKMANSDFLSQF